MTWNRVLWGVELKSTIKNEPPTILGSRWHFADRRGHDGEPSRVLLFCTRKQARDWCRGRNERDEHLGWKYTPIKVSERVEKITEEQSNG